MEGVECSRTRSLVYYPHAKISPIGSISKDLQLDLKKAGLIHKTDQITRLLYSTDASIYQVMPLGVVWPRESQRSICRSGNCQKTQGSCSSPGRRQQPGRAGYRRSTDPGFLPLYGSNPGLNPEEKTVTAQPGVILGSLNRLLAATD